MTQVFPLVSIVLSMIIMMVIAAKWNLPTRSFVSGVLIYTILAYIPFLWIFHRSDTDMAMFLSMIGHIGLALGIAFMWLMLRFWRDRERVPLETEAVVLSPADGRVKYLNREKDNK